MKKNKTILTLFLSILFFSCSVNDISDNISEDAIPFSPDQLQGFWEISLYSHQVRNIYYDGIDIKLLIGDERIDAINDQATTLGGYEIDVNPREVNGKLIWTVQIGFNITNDAHAVLEDIAGVWDVVKVHQDAAKIEFENILNPAGDLEILHLERVTE